MIRPITHKDIPECVEVIKASFMTVAGEFGFTVENAPRFTAFATTEERLNYHLEEEKRPMYAYELDGKIVGYYSLYKQSNEECELNNLCVLPQYRNEKIGEKLLLHSFSEAKQMGCSHINIGIVEENKKLRSWYESYGVLHVKTEKFEFFPFTCGYMKKML